MGIRNIQNAQNPTLKTKSSVQGSGKALLVANNYFEFCEPCDLCCNYQTPPSPQESSPKTCM